MNRTTKENKRKAKKKQRRGDTPKRPVSQKFIAFFVHPRKSEFSRSIGTLQSTPVSPSRIKPNRKRLRTDSALLLLRTVWVGLASPLMSFSVVIASERLAAVGAEVLLLRLGLLFPDSSSPRTPDLLHNHFGGYLGGLLIEGGGSGVVLA